MNLEGFSKRGMELGNDPEQINKGSEYNDMDYSKSDLLVDYDNQIDRLVDLKNNNSLSFNRVIDDTVIYFNALGLHVTREIVMNDIENKLSSKFFDLDANTYNNDIINNSELNNNTKVYDQKVIDQIEMLKANLGSIFGGKVSNNQEEQGVKHR